MHRYAELGRQRLERFGGQPALALLEAGQRNDEALARIHAMIIRTQSGTPPGRYLDTNELAHSTLLTGPHRDRNHLSSARHEEC